VELVNIDLELTINKFI